MKIIDNSINAAVLIVSVLFSLTTWTVEGLGRALERRLVFVSLGGGPRTRYEWIEVLLFYAAIIVLINIYF